MASNRLETLRSMVEKSPGDAFARYGLAMEYRSSGELESAVREFRALLEMSPDYAAACYQCGQTLEKLGRRDEARVQYGQGIEIASRTGDRHTQNELQLALDLLG
jgi:Flp pilus assembly protein TadD